MCIYEQIVDVPHTSDTHGFIRQWQWAPLWRAGVDQLRTAWERRIEDVDFIRNEHFQVLEAISEGIELGYAIMATARLKGFASIFPLWGGAKGRLEHFERFNWPHERRLRDTDGFIVYDRATSGGRTLWEYARFVGRSNGRDFGEPTVFATYAEAADELERRVFSFLNERERTLSLSRETKLGSAKRSSSNASVRRTKPARASEAVIDVVPVSTSNQQGSEPFGLRRSSRFSRDTNSN